MRYSCVFICLLHFSVLFSQNLLMDGSFENCTPDFQCNWHILIQSPDLFTKNLEITKNKGFARAGNLAHTGEHYLGMFLGYKSEFVIGTLKAPLEVGKVYNIGMYVQLSPKTVNCENNFNIISVWFTDTIPAIVVNEDFGIDSKYIPLKGKNKYLSNSKNWELVTGYYTAKGGEKYILIGNFKGANLEVTEKCKAQYYFMDDVFVNEKQAYLKNPTIGKAIEIKNIFFESGKSDLLIQSFEALNELVTILEMNMDWSIEIRGHTDAIGDEAANLNLSTQRAKAIYDYLMKQGITAERLRFKGFGESQPVASNINEVGRSKNRRVEFVITKIDSSKK